MNALGRRIGFLLLLVGILSTAIQGYRNEPSASLLSSSVDSNLGVDMDLVQTEKLSPLMRSILRIRGGEEEEAEEEEVDDDDDDDEEGEETAPVAGIDYNAIMQKAVDVTKEIIEVTKVKVFPVVSKYSVKGAVTAKKTSITVYKAIRRAISAAFEKEDSDDEDDEDEDEDDEDEAPTVLDKFIAISKKTVAVVKRMVNAAMTVPEDEVDTEEAEDDEEQETAEDFEEEKEDEATKKSETIEPEETSDKAATDFGDYLSEAWGIADERDSGKGKGVTILGGSLQDALLAAKQEARMLLVFIPSEKPESERGGLSFFGGKKGDVESEENDKVAIESLLSAEVSKAANKKARKKGDGSGSFAIWVAKAGSPEATAAIKQLKLKETSAKGKKRPIMSVIYPALSSVSFSSFPRVFVVLYPIFSLLES